MIEAVSNTEKSKYMYTCIKVANLMGSDSPPAPTPVHLYCWEHYLEGAGYIRALGAKEWIFKRKWYTSPPCDGDVVVTCYHCKEPI